MRPWTARDQETIAAIERARRQNRKRFYEENPRADQPWQVAEEKRLECLMRRGATLMEAAKKLGRTHAAVSARWAELRRHRARLQIR